MLAMLDGCTPRAFSFTTAWDSLSVCTVERRVGALEAFIASRMAVTSDYSFSSPMISVTTAELLQKV